MLPVGTREGLLRLVRRRLKERVPETAVDPARRRAAVLVPLLFNQAPHVLFTQRTEWVATHKGQISFPGGLVEPGETDAAAAAVRETGEEVGVPASEVQVLGRLDDHLTNATMFIISPFVGVIPAGVAHVRSPEEVARLLEVPLEFLLDDAHREPDARTHHWQYRWGEHVIWGATARILNGFLGILGLADPFAEDQAILGRLADAGDRLRFIELMSKFHPRRASAAQYLRAHPSTAAPEAIHALVRSGVGTAARRA